jgi:hypothetical protein
MCGRNVEFLNVKTDGTQLQGARGSVVSLGTMLQAGI